MRFLAIIITLLGLLSHSFAQIKIGLTLPPKESKVTFPFKLVNNLIVIPLTINNQITLNFIMDTGANTAILTDRLFADIMSLSFDRTIHITGPGLIDSIEAHVANRVNINLPGRVRGKNMSLLVLEKDYIELKKNLGEDIYGIIGHDIFKRFVVEVDYQNLELTLHNPNKFKPSRRFAEYDMEIEKTKPYIITEIENGKRKERVKLMIDTGASHALLLERLEIC